LRSREVLQVNAIGSGGIEPISRPHAARNVLDRNVPKSVAGDIRS
jgi:hypothetical protein